MGALRHAAVEAGRDDGDPDLVAQRVVDDRAEDDVGVGVRGLGDQRGRLVDLEQPRSEPPAIESRTPFAPSIEDSSSGLEIAISAAATARSSPRAEPIPISAEPASDITDFTSAKSRLIRPGRGDQSVMPRDALEQHLVGLPEGVEHGDVAVGIDSSRSLGMTIRVSTSFRRSAMPSSAESARRRPSNANGRVTTPIVSAPS